MSVRKVHNVGDLREVLDAYDDGDSLVLILDRTPKSDMYLEIVGVYSSGGGRICVVAFQEKKQPTEAEKRQRLRDNSLLIADQQQNGISDAMIVTLVADSLAAGHVCDKDTQEDLRRIAGKLHETYIQKLREGDKPPDGKGVLGVSNATWWLIGKWVAYVLSLAAAGLVSRYL